MEIGITKLFARLLFWLYRLLDNIFNIFGVLCGIVPIETEGETAARSLIEIFLESDAVSRAFFLILLVGIAVASMSSIVAIVKNIINLKGGERKSQLRILGQGFGAVITSMVMAVVMIAGITFANTVLKEVYKSIGLGETETISQQLFDMSVGKTYKTHVGVVERKIEVYNEEKGIFEWVTEKDENGEAIVESGIIKERGPDGEYLYESGWKNGNKPTNLDFNTQTPDDIFGVHKKILFFEDGTQSYTKSPMVEMESFNFFSAFLTVVIMLVAIIWSMLGLVKRIYDLAVLFVSLPLIAGTIPLDDGARFKRWRDSVLSKIVLAYGVVISIGVFTLITPIIKSLNFDSLGWDASTENIFKMFLYMGGALSINSGMLLVARLMGTSAEESREMAQSARALAAGVMAAGGMLRGAKNLAFGGYNKYGRHHKGIIPWAAEKADKYGSKHGENYDGSKLQRVLQKIGRVDASKTRDGASNPGTGNVAPNSLSAGADASAIKPDGTAANAVVAALAGNVRGAMGSPANSGGVRLNSVNADKRMSNNQSAAFQSEKAGSNLATGNQNATKPNAPHAGLVGNMLNKDGKNGGYAKPKKTKE